MRHELLFVTRKWAPAMGGMETYCQRLVERLERRRSLGLMALPGRADGRAPSVLSLLTFGITTFIRLFFSPPAQIVHVSDMASWPLAWAAALRSRNTTIVISAHGTDLSYAGRKGGLPAAYGLYMRVGACLLPRAHIIANSHWIAGLAHNMGFRHVSVIRMGTDLTPPLEMPIPNGKLLFAGRITPGKGLRFLVEDVLPLIDDPPKLRVAGSIWDEREAACLASPHVEWLGTLEPEGLAREYASALAVLVPSRMPEGFGLVAAEAAACGGVVIAADHSGLAEALLPGTGFLLPSEDAAAWARCIAAVRHWSETDRSVFVANSTTTACSSYRWDRAADETEAVYSQIGANRMHHNKR